MNILTLISKKSNPIVVLTALLKRLRIPVSSFTIKNSLENHPDYPSLLSLSDSLTSWNVSNQAMQLDKETLDVEELPLPFIAHLKIDRGQLLLVNEISGNTVHFSNEDEYNGKLRKDEFLKRWDGIILYAEKDEQSGEADSNQALIKGFFNQVRLPFLIGILISASIYTISQYVVVGCIALTIVVSVIRMQLMLLLA